MRSFGLPGLVGFLALAASVGCTGAGLETPVERQAHAGWYMQRAGQDVFLPCGQSQPLRLSGATELRARARKFGLAPDTPVYVRLQGRQSANDEELEVSGVEQFGSPTPVRDCGLTGIAIPAPPPAGN